MSEDQKTIKTLELLAFLISSARGLFEEPHEYGPLRCLDGARRLIDLILEFSLIEDKEVNEYLQKLRNELYTGVLLVMSNPEEFKKFTININIDFAKKVVEILNKYEK